MNMFISFFQRLSIESTPQFHMFSMTHFITLVIAIGIIYVTWKYSHKLRDWKYENIFRYTLGIMMIYTNVNLWTYSYSLGQEWYHYLPIATCGYATFFGGLTLITRNKTIFKLTFFWGFGAVLSLLGPTMIEGPLKYNFYQFFFRHIGIVVIPLYMMKVYGYKIGKKDWRLFLYVTLSLTFASSIINFAVNKPDELNMFYTMQPAIAGTPLNWFYDVSRWLYIAFWIPFAALLGYLYGLPFYNKKNYSDE